MKRNSQLLLLSLYQPSHQPMAALPLNITRVAVPHLTGSGWRSLVFGLQHHGYLEVYQDSEAGKLARLTGPGHLLLSALFPALNERKAAQPDWSCIFCLSAPPQDPGFRYFRTQLEKLGAIPLQRGSYLVPTELPVAFLSECATLYPRSVVIGKVTEWVFGDFSQLLKQAHLLQDLNSLYSGVSSELSRLLGKNYAEILLMQQEKSVLSSIFDRLATGLQKDSGLVRYLFPNAPQPQKLVGEWQQLVAATDMSASPDVTSDGQSPTY